MTDMISELPSRAKEVLTIVLKDKGSWHYGLGKSKGLLKGPNMWVISERYSELWQYQWQEEIFFPRYFRMLHLIQLIKKDDAEWVKNHIHQHVSNGEEQDYFECFGPSDCDMVLNEALERVQYRYRLTHEKEWGPITISEELVEEMNIFPESQLSIFGGESYAENRGDTSKKG